MTDRNNSPIYSKISYGMERAMEALEACGISPERRPNMILLNVECPEITIYLNTPEEVEAASNFYRRNLLEKNTQRVTVLFAVS